MYGLVDADSLCYKAGANETERDVRMYIDNTIRTMISAGGTSAITGWVEMHGGKSNFRNHVATTLPYKGNRSGPKPPYLNYAKDYMVEQYGFHWARWVESEDMVLINASRIGYDKCVIFYYDKDLLQVPGSFINYRDWSKVSLSEEQAEFNLYSQFLTGDKSCDNIPGLNGVGKVGASKALTSSDRADWPVVVAKMYAERGHTYDYLLEQCRLLYLLRHMNEVYQFPIDRQEYGAIVESIGETKGGSNGIDC